MEAALQTDLAATEGGGYDFELALGDNPADADAVVPILSAVHDQVHGTGLGLNPAKRIVEDDGGAIRAESMPRNTHFIVKIPVAPEELVDVFSNTAGYGRAGAAHRADRPFYRGGAPSGDRFRRNLGIRKSLDR